MKIARLTFFSKIHNLVIWFVRISLLVAIVGAVVKEEWMVLAVSLIALALTFIPFFIQKRYRLQFPVELTLLVVLFVYVSLFLGDLQGLYYRFWWWDIMLHSISGVALGYVGFIILYMMLKRDKIVAKPITIAVFSLCFALAFGAIWEITEFVIDNSIGTNMQRGSLQDTMFDLMADFIGGLIASISGFSYLRGKKVKFFDRAVERFVEHNAHLFEK